jgi:glutamyl-tRNA reductase
LVDSRFLRAFAPSRSLLSKGVQLMQLLLLGLNHSTAPLEVREKMAFTADQRRHALWTLREAFAGSEAALLSTCNRVEIYVAPASHPAAAEGPSHEQLRELLLRLRGLERHDLDGHLYAKSDRDVIAHLFSVASSLDSMVVGETQIIGQVRAAYDEAREVGVVGPALHPLFQRAVSVGKQVMSQTKITEGRISVGSVAVDLAARVFEHYRDKTVLCIGAGKMAALVLQAFSALRPKRLLVCNRDPLKAQRLGEKYAGQAVPFERLDEHLALADVVVTSTGSQQPIITRARFEPLLKRRRYRPVFLIDIALPRDIAPGVGELENVYLYNIDDLQQVVSATYHSRSQAVEDARLLVAQQVEKFTSWHRAREMGPMIDRLYQRHHALAREELDRTLNKLPNISPAERQHLEELTRRIVNKLLHDPIRALRETDSPHGMGPHGTGQAYLHAMEKLFDLTAPDALDEPEAQQ